MENKNPKIYIISGKARHGKDTVAKIIKDEYESIGLKVINLQYSSYIKEYAKKISNWDGDEKTKPRELLQQLGTNIIRKNIDNYFFVNKLIDDIKVYSYFFDVITVSDARFSFEIDIPKDKFKNTYSVKVERPNFDNGLTEEEKHHASEISLDDYDNYDYKIINDGTIDDLISKVQKMIGR